MKLFELAKSLGYSDELCDFLNMEKSRLILIGVGSGVVRGALQKKLSETSIIKIALANEGNAFGHDYVIFPDEQEPTLEEYEEDGKKIFRKHLNPDGSFRFPDFWRRHDES